MDNLDAITSLVADSIDIPDVEEIQIAGPGPPAKARTGEHVTFTVTMPPLVVKLDAEGFDPDSKLQGEYTTDKVVEFIEGEIAGNIRAGASASSAIIDIWCLFEDGYEYEHATITVKVE